MLMNSRLLKKALRYIGGWAIIIFFVVLLTFIFSFLGTIICAALAGMMIGAARLPRFHALCYSCIFPLVIFGVLRFSKAELTAAQIGLLAALCFGIFWLIYCVMVAMLSFEHKPGAAAQSTCKKAPAVQTQTVTAGNGHGAMLDLSFLDGRWIAQPVNCPSAGVCNVIEITRENVRCILQCNGTQATCRGRLTLNHGASAEPVEAKLETSDFEL
jgi:hypothetical protein